MTKKIYLENLKKCPGLLYFTLLTCPTSILKKSIRDVPKTSFSDALKTYLYGSINKTKKLLYLVIASMNIVTKMASRAQQTDDMEGENINYL